MSEVSQVNIDRSGRVRIPKAIRTQLGLSPGTTLVVETLNDEEIRLRPVHEKPQLVDKDGVLVVQSPAVGELGDIERREREARIAELVQRVGL
ncbi:MAG: AbrB/MazE/SpoVT family DNA-binding domain-containing protein [Candidatus Bipolaricaulia bacterium]